MDRNPFKPDVRKLLAVGVALENDPSCFSSNQFSNIKGTDVFLAHLLLSNVDSLFYHPVLIPMKWKNLSL